MEVSDDPRSSLKAALLPSQQAFTSLQDKLADMSSDCEMNIKEYEAIQRLDGNQRCIDCGASNPDWGSPSLGILFCFQCSGQHRCVSGALTACISSALTWFCCRCHSSRLSAPSPIPSLLLAYSGLGTHISFVRSVTMDQWTEPQLALMRVGGNQSCRAFLEQHDIAFGASTIRQRYDSSAAALYKQVLIARVKGLPEPTELDVASTRDKPPQMALKDKIQGFGSSPMPEPDTNKKMVVIVAAGSLVACGVAAVVFFLR
ncbi:hypothetical protein MPSEU_000192400 [Mayamaea pseudoterrestris]|nr:hypothetical protein MPSEU_000192400 [Mayamaea pseudoterrestris]